MTGLELKDKRTTIKMTQTEFAEAAGLSCKNVVSKYECGHWNISRSNEILFNYIYQDYITKNKIQ